MAFLKFLSLFRGVKVKGTWNHGYRAYMCILTLLKCLRLLLLEIMGLVSALCVLNIMYVCVPMCVYDCLCTVTLIISGNVTGSSMLKLITKTSDYFIFQEKFGIAGSG